MSEHDRVLIADDHEMVRKGLRSMLESSGKWKVCGEATDGREAVRKAARLRPDIVIMDLTMPELNGLDATREIRRILPDCEVLVVTVHHSEQLVHEVLEAGAKGYVLKSDAGESIMAALDELARHKPYFTSAVSQVLLSAFLSPDRPDVPDIGGLLTPREREIVQLIAEGRSTKEIATTLGISDKTVETHRANLMRKLDVHSVSEIVRYAIRNRMIEA